MKIVYIYTDGSCSPNPGEGGWAWVAVDEEGIEMYDEGSGHVPNTTNMRMELKALYEAAKYAQKISGLYEIVFYTDSQVALELLAGTYNAKKNVDLVNKTKKEYMKVYEQATKCIIKHVKAHSGYKWNEYVNNLANEARKTDLSYVMCKKCKDKGWYWVGDINIPRTWGCTCTECNTWTDDSSKNTC